jgi:Family of unknown function (DUF6527)
MPKLIPIVAQPAGAEETIGYRFWCPACRALHPLYTVKWGDCPVWWFNGNLQRPQFAPSLRMIQENNCHLYVTDGLLAYCNDCRHEYRNKTVPMVDFDTERWCPVDTLHTINGKPVDATATEAPAAKQDNPTVTASTTHQEACGNVGITGEHGDLGSNKKQ